MPKTTPVTFSSPFSSRHSSKTTPVTFSSLVFFPFFPVTFSSPQNYPRHVFFPGLFYLEDDSPGGIFIMGGIGITPSMSILRSARDRGDQRSFIVIYGNSKWEEAAFRNELESLKKELNLRVVHVLSDADSDWQGETGYITQEILQRHIGDQERDHSIFVCGPEPMMDSVEDALLAMRVPLHQIRAERFDIA